MPDGSIKHLHVVAHGARNQDGDMEVHRRGSGRDAAPTSRKRRSARLRSELAHVARVTSLGALTASIAHEVNQPLSGIITNASTCLRMLAADPPNIDGRARNRAAHDSRWQPRGGSDHPTARALRQEGAVDRTGGPERGDARGDRAVVERAAEKPGDRAGGTGRRPPARHRRPGPAAAGHPEPAAATPRTR